MSHHDAKGVEEALWLPFSSPSVPIGVIAVYLVSIVVLHYWMRDRKPFQLRFLLALHNFVLCGLSLLMSLGVLLRTLTIGSEYGLLAVYCGTWIDEIDERTRLWPIIFYLSKYYELLDTVFVILRKKDLTVLHVWHHASVVFVCWLANRDLIVMGWITCFQNATVHILMYYYYGMMSLQKRDYWWRKYLTSIQIVQFILDITTSIPYPFLLYNGIACRGTLQSWLVANLTGFTFFLLFMDFYRKTYKAKQQAKKD